MSASSGDGGSSGGGISFGRAGLLLLIPIVIAALFATGMAVRSQVSGFSDMTFGQSLSWIGELFGSILGVGGSFIGPVGIGLLVVVALAIAVMGSVVDDEDSDASSLVRLSFAIRAIGPMIVVWVLWRHFDGWREMFAALWWVIPLLVVGYIAYVYLLHRREVARPGPAINRTQNTIQRNVSVRAGQVAGWAVLVIAFAAAVISGVLGALDGVGDVILQFAGEAAYLLTVWIGYILLGGDTRGAWIVPNITAGQWLGLTLLIGGIAIAVSTNR